MADWRDPDRGEERSWRDRRERALVPRPGLERGVQGGHGEGEFERGGRPAGGYAQGGYGTHEPQPYGGRREQEGYGAMGGGYYRERRHARREEDRGQGRREGAGGRTVYDVMTPYAEVLDPNMTVREAARRMRSDQLGAYPVGEFDRLIGMVTDRDIVVRAVASDRKPSTMIVREVMSEDVIYCFEDEGVEEAAQLMADHQVRRLPVLNRDKRLVGMVALADLGVCDPDAAKQALYGVSQRTEVPRRFI